MRRIKQQLTKEECSELLRTEKRGVLSVVGDDGYPYGIPMDFWYDEESGKIGFHTAQEGHKIDSILRCEKASFCIFDEGYRKEGEWALNIKSVIVFGKIKLVEDEALKAKICRNLTLKFVDDEDYIQTELKKYLKRVLCLELTPEHITGKLVNES